MLLMRTFSLFMSLFCIICHFCVLSALNPDTRYTPLEKEALKQYKLAVADMLYEDYHKLDSHLIHFLRHKKLNVTAAASLLKDNFNWRKAEGIDSILREKRMLDLAKQLPISSDGVDRDGRPILTTIIGQQDIRKFVVTGKTQEYFRYNVYNTEKMSQKVYDKALAGEDVSQYVVLADFSGFNLRQHVCLPCLPESTAFIQLVMERYPNIVHQIIYVNAPRAFTSFFSLIKSVLPPDFLKTIHVFGFDKSEWRSHLSKSIVDDQISSSFGGTRI